MKKWFNKFIMVLLAFLLLGSALLVVFSGLLDQNSSGIPNNNIDVSPSPTLTPGSPGGPSPTPSIPDGPDVPIQIVDKDVPSGYEMGLFSDIPLRRGMGASIIDSASDKYSFRFTAQFSGDVVELSIKGMTTNGEPTLRVGLQADVNGVPSGDWLSTSSFGFVEFTSKFEFKTVTLNSPAYLTEGLTYHIVMEPFEFSLDDRLAILNFNVNDLMIPFNSEDVDLVQPDLNINSLTFDGENWRVSNKYPIFVIKNVEGELFGQPYSLVAPWFVSGSTYVGQTIVPASSYNVGTIAFVVSLKKDTPLDDLYYDIRDSDNKILGSGLFVTSSSLGVRPEWVEVDLPSPILFEAGELYRVVVSSPGSTFEDAYYFYGYEFSFSNDIGYGGLQHRLCTSSNSGERWVDNFDADAAFKLITR